LVVNDQHEQVDFLRELFSQSGYRVLAAYDGSQALSIAVKEGPDVIVSDVLMPRLDGIELCRLVREHVALRDTPVVLMSGLRTDSESIAKGFSAGADDYLEVPCDPGRIVAKVARLGERRRATLIQRASESELRAMFSAMSDLVFMFDVEGRYLRIAPTNASRLYRPSAELIGRTIHDVFPLEQANLFLTSIRRALNEQKPHALEYTLRIGECDIWFAATVSPMSHDAVFWVARDVTDYKVAEEALRDSETRVRLLLDSTAEAIFALDHEGRCTLCNRAGLEMLGYEQAEDVLGKSIHNLVRHTRMEGTPHPVEECRLMEALQGTGVQMGNEVIWRRDGTSFPIKYWASPVRVDERVVGGVVTFIDITDEQLLQEKYLQAQKMEGIGRLAAGIAHDFNNLLTAIIGFGGLLRRELPAASHSVHDVDQILAAGDRAAALTRQLLAFSRKQVLKPTLLDITDVVAKLSPMLQRLIGDDVELQIVTRGGDTLVRADAGQLEQVVMNLAVNGRDAMPDGGTLMIETARVDVDDAYATHHPPMTAGEYVMLEVSDTGHGMDEHVRTHVFEPFFTTKGPAQGTGLGLSTVYGIVKQSDGYIWVLSEPGHGSTFQIYLPPAPAGATEAALTRELRTIPSRGNETVLLVEDAPLVRALAYEVLTRTGYTVLSAGNGDEAVAIASRHAGEIHLLISDVVMPGITCRALAEMITSLHPGIRVLFMSGYADETIAERGFLEPGVPFLDKPFSPQELASRIREVLDVD
jgi:PAS domain S-box-containing protein